MAITPRSCERARAWVSLDLDDELSELESAMLRAHVKRCAACARFRSDASTFTASLRLAPLEPLPAPIVLPVRRRSVARAMQVGAVAAVAIAAAGIGTLLSAAPERSPYAAPVPSPTAVDLQSAYLDAPRGLPQRPPSEFRPRIGLDPGHEI